MRTNETIVMAVIIILLFVIFMGAVGLGVANYYIIVMAIEGIFKFIIGAF